jgi:2-keto-4-pentenoate hydratase/2-oxohepta-3-ene-1,7-dioic acid hydratase in catechol pathway
MKLVMFRARSDEKNRARAGALLPSGEILALAQAASELGMEERPSHLLGSLHEMLSEWNASLDLTKGLVEKAMGSDVEAAALKSSVYRTDSVTICPPLSSPGKFICPGMNFADHITEQKGRVGRERPIPVAFAKFSTAIIGPDEPLYLPEGIEQVDYEVEVAAVMSRRVKRVNQEDALSHVAGYMILNDISARGVQVEEMNRGLLLLGKNFDGFAPMGPWLVTADEIPEPQNLEMELWIGGEPEPRQKSNTGKMIYSFAEMIAYWSQVTLEPGDVISSGTPSGVAAFREPDPGPWYLKPGQVVTAKVEKLGELRTPIARAGTVR